MKNLRSYEAINEAAAALPTMPAFLKTAKAKAQHVRLGGPWTKDQTPNAWVVSAKPTTGKETWEVVFFPNGTFHTMAGVPKGAFLKSGGKWKADASASFRIGATTIKGVAMTFTSYMVLNPPS
jgi:hypothetical protein